MIWVLLSLVVIILILCTILFLKLKVFIDYYHGNDNDHLEITLRALFGLLKYKVNVPVIKVAEDSPSLVVHKKVGVGNEEKDKKHEKVKFTAEEILHSIQDMQHFLKHVSGFYKIVRSFLKKVTVSRIEWITVVGVGDAAYTGMLTGAFWTAKGSLLGLISTLMKVKTIPKIMITPEFNRAISQTSFQCMIHFRIGHAIFAGIKLIKFWKGGRPNFKSKPLSIFSSKTKSV